MSSLQQRLQWYMASRPAWVTVLYISLVSFSVYTCMYGYRKAFTAARYDELAYWGISLKVWLVTAQVLGYMFSKFYGIRFIAENIAANRSRLIVQLILLAWLALLGFAVLPAPFNIIMMFCNGFPLGMVWGLVFSYVEGRRATELMGAVLASSFIFASGFAKSVAAWLMGSWQVPPHWMPFVAGAIYLLPLLAASWLLQAVPPPTPEDIAQRTVRLPMDAAQRRSFLRNFAPGLVALIIAYVLLTVLRDFRDNFSNELLAELQLTTNAAVFAKTETLVALLVLAGCALLMLFRQNIKAFYANHLLVMAGLLLAGGSTWLFQAGLLSGMAWFLCVGTGLYLGYIPINCFYFDRMIASFRLAANVGFVMYVADSFGYLGSVLVLFLKEFAGISLSWGQFFAYTLYASCSVGLLCTAYAMFYYRKKYQLSVHANIAG